MVLNWKLLELDKGTVAVPPPVTYVMLQGAQAVQPD